MCGIVGIVSPTGRNDQRIDRVRDAVAVMTHRGPDDHFCAQAGETAYWGMCRLAIRDPAAGKQPFVFGQLEIIFNGEIYNTDELRNELERQGYHFETDCDTEVVLKNFAANGLPGFARLDGIFALAVLDHQRRELTLARDHNGVKPLFYTHNRGSLRFASEPKALRLVCDEKLDVSFPALASYLTYQYVPEPLTAWTNVRKVAPGEARSYSLDSAELLAVTKFEHRSNFSLGAPKSPGDWLDTLDSALDATVQSQMVSDRPLGVFLSGGVDSTLISLYSSRHHHGISAYGVTVPDWDQDEQSFIRFAAERLEIDLHEVELGFTDFEKLLTTITSVYDEPFADYSAIPTLAVSAAAGASLRVVLSGDGADESFGGYARYDQAPLLGKLAALPTPIVRMGAYVLRRLPFDGAWATERMLDEVRRGADPYCALLAIRNGADAERLLLGGAATATPLYPLTNYRERLRRVRATDAREAAMAVDSAQYLIADIHTKVDRATMRYSLEARVPFLGGPCAAVARAMPTSIKFKDNVRKWPLKALLEREGFPGEFVHRRKTGFSLPIERWLRLAFQRPNGLADQLLDPPAPLDPKSTRSEYESFMATSTNGHAVWSLLMLATWLRDEQR